MRTRKSRVTFEHPFTLNMDSGELPAGSYNIEVEEEEILAVDRTAYRRTAVYLFVEKPGSTRMLIVEPGAFDEAVKRDAAKDPGSQNERDDAAHTGDCPSL